MFILAEKSAKERLMALNNRWITHDGGKEVVDMIHNQKLEDELK
jgi:hypothetical protein